jgi:hypothetical protein
MHACMRASQPRGGKGLGTERRHAATGTDSLRVPNTMGGSVSVPHTSPLVLTVHCTTYTHHRSVWTSATAAAGTDTGAAAAGAGQPASNESCRVRLSGGAVGGGALAVAPGCCRRRDARTGGVSAGGASGTAAPTNTSIRRTGTATACAGSGDRESGVGLSEERMWGLGVRGRLGGVGCCCCCCCCCGDARRGDRLGLSGGATWAVPSNGSGVRSARAAAARPASTRHSRTVASSEHVAIYGPAPTGRVSSDDPPLPAVSMNDPCCAQ